MQYSYSESLLYPSKVSIPNRDFGKLQSDSQKGLVPIGGVSIPNRDFGKLQLSLEFSVGAPEIVSIPNRDFGKLQWREAESQAVFSFQGAVARFKSNNSIREFVWQQC